MSIAKKTIAISISKINLNLCKVKAVPLNLEFKIWNFFVFCIPLPLKLIFSIEIEKV